MLVLVVVVAAAVVVHPPQHGMEIHICCITKTFSHHLETEEGCLSDSLGNYVLSCCVCPGAEGFVSVDVGVIVSFTLSRVTCFVYAGMLTSR